MPNGLEQNLPQGADICPVHKLNSVPVFSCARHEGACSVILTFHGTWQ